MVRRKAVLFKKSHYKAGGVLLPNELRVMVLSWDKILNIVCTGIFFLNIFIFGEKWK